MADLSGGQLHTTPGLRPAPTSTNTYKLLVPDLSGAQLKFNGESVPAKVNLSGEGLEKVPVGRQTSFMIAGQGDMGDPEVKILSPLREIVTSSIRCVGEGQYEVDYAPEVVGDHQVEVKMAGLHVQGSPFIVMAYDATVENTVETTPGNAGDVKLQVPDLSGGIQVCFWIFLIILFTVKSALYYYFYMYSHFMSFPHI